MSIFWGVNIGHDASICVIKDDTLVFAAQSERYSKKKNDGSLSENLIFEALSFGQPSTIYWPEKPFFRTLRQFYSGQKISNFSHEKSILNKLAPIKYVPHHKAHAAAGYYTSPFQEAAVLVVDAIGEWDCTSIWKASGNSLKKVYAQKYPHSLGLFYSAMTQRCGLMPNEEEYILMGMAAYGKSIHKPAIYSEFINSDLTFKVNMHRGVKNWQPNFLELDIAASTQDVLEESLIKLVNKAEYLTGSKNIVFSGGVALNCVANSKLAQIFPNIWIFPNPGDSGNSLGAVLAEIKQKLLFKSIYLGTEINKEYSEEYVTEKLISGDILGIANGRAEFGPRALGNRSLIADPRGVHIKDKVNDIKRRQKFRPFAPVILEEEAYKYFDMPVKTSPFMQFTAQCKRPDLYPAICHVDGSSRVQTLNKKQNEKFYSLLKLFYEKTGCPMLLNTSLNIRGEPMVNTWEDALRFSKTYDIEVL